MSCNVTTTFVCVPQSDEVLGMIRTHADAVEAALGAPCPCHVRIERQHRHHGPGEIFYVEVALHGENEPGRYASRAVHDEIEVALSMAFQSLLARVRRGNGATASARLVSGHIARILAPEGIGMLTTDGGRDICFQESDVADEAFATLKLGDRVWWMCNPKGGGRLICLARATCPGHPVGKADAKPIRAPAS